MGILCRTQEVWIELAIEELEAWLGIIRTARQVNRSSSSSEPRGEERTTTRQASDDARGRGASNL